MEPRPFVSLPDVRLLADPPDSYAFPSGHATYAFSASFGAVLAARWLLGRVPLWGGGLLALAAAISYSRIYVGVHYPSDLLSGAVLGAFVGCITAPLTIHFHQ
jgi:undecaprenyl-diphosphatase